MEAMLKSIGKSGKTTTFLPDGSKFTLILLPDKVTRNNHYMSPHTITDSLNVGGSLLKGGKDGCQIIVVDQDIEESVTAVAVAIARAMPVYTSKSLSNKQQQDANCADEAAAGGGYLHLVNVSYYTELNEGKVVQDEDLNSAAKAVADGVRLAGRLGDMPPAELDPETYSKECMEIVEGLIAKGHQVEMEEIVGEELRDQGYGGIYGVGMAAIVPPRMVILTYTPEGGGDDDLENVALCGKGVVYDTGGLSLKGKAGMCGMKHDMGGSAGVLGGFKAAVELKVPKKITLILAIVENAIGPKAFRNDDILTMYSGKTVEINNTDAEGRLVLADCVAHASKNIKGVDIIMDMATLTGAQLVTTGKKHAGILAQSEELEKRMFECGLKSGDLCYPMLYAPELLKSEFASKVADMKNSVKDRGNAQASCAGHFIESHLDPSYEGDWVHVDMAGPDSKNERATGYGVALVLGLLQVPSFC